MFVISSHPAPFDDGPGLSSSVKHCKFGLASQEPQGRRCLINFPAEADGRVFECFLRRALRGVLELAGLHTEALRVKGRQPDSFQQPVRSGSGGPVLIKINICPESLR